LQYKLFLPNRKLSKITVAMAGITVIAPAAVAAGMAASGGSPGNPALLAMTGHDRPGSHAGHTIASAHPGRGTHLTGPPLREVAGLSANRILAEWTAARAAAQAAALKAARQAARHAAARQVAAQAQPAPAQPVPAPPGPAQRPTGSPQRIARAMLGAYGWPLGQFGCLLSLWNAESGWNVYASNPSSGAYGIPQALPGSKMASAGPDWQSNPATQIAWGLGYIRSLYSSPCGAWAHEQADGWY
jgi:hypothetical protein